MNLHSTDSDALRSTACPADPNLPIGEGATVLIVEDNALNLDLFSDVLAAKGFRILQAETGEEALSIACEALPDLILMDLNLPGIDGLTATRELRKNPATSHLKIVAITAHAMRGDQEIAFEAGCNGYLTKPIDTRSFPLVVARFIKGSDGLRSPCPPIAL